VKQSTNNDRYMLIDDLTFIEFNKKHEVSGVKLIKNKLSPLKISYAKVSCYFLHISMERKLKQMEVAGLIGFYMREYSNRKYLELIEEEDEPKVFTLDQLAIGFEAFLLFLGAGAIVFVFEILSVFLKKIAV